MNLKKVAVISRSSVISSTSSKSTKQSINTSILIAIVKLKTTIIINKLKSLKCADNSRCSCCPRSIRTSRSLISNNSNVRRSLSLRVFITKVINRTCRTHLSVFTIFSSRTEKYCLSKGQIYSARNSRTINIAIIITTIIKVLDRTSNV